jgi:rRNA maturation RNase YbeY
MTIHLFKRTTKHPLLDRQRLVEILVDAMSLSGLNDQLDDSDCLHVILLGNKAMTKLNEDFLGHEGSTDVISFDLRDDSPSLPDDPEPVIGELYICLDIADQAATDYGTSCSHEAVLYSVHGMLHLVGFDDREPKDIAAMRKAESRVMTALAKKHSLKNLFA